MFHDGGIWDWLNTQSIWRGALIVVEKTNAMRMLEARKIPFRDLYFRPRHPLGRGGG